MVLVAFGARPDHGALGEAETGGGPQGHTGDALVRNHTLARAIGDASWREMRGMLAYKAQWYGRDLVVVERWYPSSKLCSGCGHRAAQMPLNVRAWTCSNCGATHDRDTNPAINIEQEGRRIVAAGLAET